MSRLGTMAFLSVCILCAWLMLAAAQAKTGAAQAASSTGLTFNAVSVVQSPRGATADLGGCCGVQYLQARIRGVNVSLVDLILSAYRLQRWQLSGGPAWANPSMLSTENRYNVEATAPSSVTPQQMREMLQVMLAERFQLSLGRSTAAGAAWDLLVDRGGLHLEATPLGNDEPQRIQGGGGRLIVNRMTMPELARYLEGQELVQAPVTDRTGLSGSYRISLHWTPERFRLTGVGVAPSNGESGIDPNGPSILTALREQLGLRLEKTTGPVEHFTIDRAERPSSN